VSRIDDLIRNLCPDGVEFRTLEEIFETRNGYTPSKNDPEAWAGNDVPWFRMDDIRSRGRILRDATQRISTSAVKGGRIFSADSILVATSATIGEHALVRVPHLSNQRFTNLAIKDDFRKSFDIKFLFYYCFKLDEWCTKNTTTSSFPSVDMKGFKKFKFPIPPLEVQQEVAKTLDQFTQLEAELETELETELEARRQQYFHYCASAFDSATDTEWTTLERVSLKISSGGTPSSSNSAYYGGDIPWVRSQDVNFNMISSTSATISDIGLKNSAAKWIPSNSLIIAMYGASAARAAINTIPVTTNQACCNLQLDTTKVTPGYAYHWIYSQYDKLRSLGEGSQSNLNARKIKNYPIPMPSLNEQRRITEALDKFHSLVNDLSSGLPAEIEARRKQYEYYRDRLLTFSEKK